jgi:hypothetical protein
MSIEFTMWRISPEAYEQAVEAGELGPEYVAENQTVAKAWSVLSYILAGGPVPAPATGAARAVAGGEVLPEDDLDYGGTRALGPALVSEVAGELAVFTDEVIEQRYYALDFTGSYGARDGVHTRPVETYMEAFHVVRDFYAEAAKHGDAMAVWLG